MLWMSCYEAVKRQTKRCITRSSGLLPRSSGLLARPSGRQLSVIRSKAIDRPPPPQVSTTSASPCCSKTSTSRGPLLAKMSGSRPRAAPATSPHGKPFLAPASTLAAILTVLSILLQVLPESGRQARPCRRHRARHRGHKGHVLGQVSHSTPPARNKTLAPQKGGWTDTKVLSQLRSQVPTSRLRRFRIRLLWLWDQSRRFSKAAPRLLRTAARLG